MKVVINNDFGGFDIPDAYFKETGTKYEPLFSWHVDRSDPKLIEWIEKNPVKGDYTNLLVVDIPEEATDYLITEYDGAETLYYVIDGKIIEFDYYAQEKDEEED